MLRIGVLFGLLLSLCNTPVIAQEVYNVDLNLPIEPGTGGSFNSGFCGTGLHCVFVSISPVYDLSGLNIPAGALVNFGTFTVSDVTVCTDPDCTTYQGFFQSSTTGSINGFNPVVLGPGLSLCTPEIMQWVPSGMRLEFGMAYSRVT
jgi:hypothetical protein